MRNRAYQWTGALDLTLGLQICKFSVSNIIKKKEKKKTENCAYFIDLIYLQEYHNKEATALGWGLVDEEIKNAPKNLKMVKLKVTNTTMENPRMIGTEVNYVKIEGTECRHCRDTCAGDSGMNLFVILTDEMKLGLRDLLVINYLLLRHLKKGGRWVTCHLSTYHLSV